MARVFRAKRKSDGKLVALKVLRGSLASQPDAVKDFIVEAKAASALKHPYLPEVYDAGEADGHYFFAMEIISGATLQKVIEKQGTIPENGALTIAKYVTEILCFAWQRRVIHRDIKPENLMVQPDLSLKLMDMGLAKAAGDGKATAGEGGGIIGTPMYASPEQIRGQRDLDCRSDIYSLGLTIYHAVTGELPYEGATSAMVMAKQLNEELNDPRQRNPDLSLNLTMMIKKMTEKDRDRRYQTPEDLLAAIENCRQRLVDRQSQPPPVEKPKRKGLFKR
jgi:serine/threonine-protein kinase